MIPFTKMNGTGNDFIVFDNRNHVFSGNETAVFYRLCQRRYGIGADGILLLENSDKSDFKMRYFNADGRESSMCGNGARCISNWAHQNGIAGKKMKFESMNSMHKVIINGNSVRMTMQPAQNISTEIELPLNNGLKLGGCLDIGVPHCVLITEDVKSHNVATLGKEIRYNKIFPEGVNVNFLQFVDKNSIKIRTYERGVEQETLACGTGAVASAIIASVHKQVESPVKINTYGGELIVEFDEQFSNIYLEGAVETVYKGTIEV